ncbi:MAG: hypothetical protein EZS28_031529 [Streblomastix strix]|uniref:Uncharacterized protein n=1 Tax=Streblomastix strix TaxID=222440 RepID=A0A5J4URX3_9EUKA|nr:MAG: hypothetical protein EZS28_031529 [Streblomastix strix]
MIELYQFEQIDTSSRFNSINFIDNKCFRNWLGPNIGGQLIFTDGCKLVGPRLALNIKQSARNGGDNDGFEIFHTGNIDQLDSVPQSTYRQYESDVLPKEIESKETPSSSYQNNNINMRGNQDQSNSISHPGSEQFPSGLSQSSSMVRGLYTGSSYSFGGSKHSQILPYSGLLRQQNKQTIEKVLLRILGPQRYKNQCKHNELGSGTSHNSPSDQLDLENYQQNNQRPCESLTNNTGLVQYQVLIIDNKCVEGIELGPIASSTYPKQENAEQRFREVSPRKHPGTTNDKSMNGEILYVNLLHLAGLTDDAIFQTLSTISFETWRKRRTGLTYLTDYIEINHIDIELLLGESPDIQIVNALAWVAKQGGEKMFSKLKVLKTHSCVVCCQLSKMKDVANSPLIKSFVKEYQLNYEAKLKYETIWEIVVLFNFISQWNTQSNSDVQVKAMALLLVFSAARMTELARMVLKDICFIGEQMQIQVLLKKNVAY